MTPSPYLPTTRRFVNPLYIRVEDVPRGRLPVRRGPHARRVGVPSRCWPRRRRRPDRPRRGLDRQARRARGRASPRRGRPPGRPAFDAFVEQEGAGLETSRSGARSPRSTARVDRVAAEPRGPVVGARSPRPRDELADRVEFHLLAAVGGRRAARGRAARGARRRHGARHHARPRRRRAPAGRRRVGARRRARPRRHRGRTAGHVQPAGPELVAAAVAPGRAGAGRVQAVPGHAAHGAAARRCHPHRPRHRPVPAVVDPRGRRLRPTAPTSATTTRRSSASWRSRRTGPARSSSGRTSASSSRGCATTCPTAGSSARRCSGSSATMHGAPLAPEHYRPLVLATVTTHDLPPSAGLPGGRARGRSASASAC